MTHEAQPRTRIADGIRSLGDRVARIEAKAGSAMSDVPGQSKKLGKQALVGAAMGMMLVKDPAKFISIVVGKDVVVGTVGEGDGQPRGDQHPEDAGTTESAETEPLGEDEDALD